MVICKLSVDVDGELESLDKELKLFAIVFKFNAEFLIEDEVRCCINPRYKGNDLFDETCTLLNWLGFDTVNSGDLAGDEAVVQWLGDTSESSFK